MQRQDGLRAQLEGERARLTQELAALAGATQTSGESDHGSYRTHSADDATETFEQERELALARHIRGVLGQIERALQKLASGSYGRCDRCDQPIDPARLAVLPAATLCLTCQMRLDGAR